MADVFPPLELIGRPFLSFTVDDVAPGAIVTVSATSAPAFRGRCLVVHPLTAPSFTLRHLHVGWVDQFAGPPVPANVFAFTDEQVRVPTLDLDMGLSVDLEIENTSDTRANFEARLYGDFDVVC